MGKHHVDYWIEQQHRSAALMSALDFVRALRGRPWLFRMLFRLAVGRYAYREAVFIQQNLHDAGDYPDFDYGLEDCEYHRRKLPWDINRSLERDRSMSNE